MWLLASCRKQQKYITQILLASYLSIPGVLLAQGVTAAHTAHAPAFDTAANGTPIVNINAANAKGVSHNQYNDLNVSQKGLIFNNSTAIVKTKLAGYIDGNKHLAGKSAGIILNEVVGHSRSALNGYMEVAGQRAQLIIANQNGITCNGCGFINTSRGVLTTGASVFDADGNLSGFDVTRGDIAITGKGFNDTDTDEVDILARSVKLNAKMWAKKATVITGNNRINNKNNSVTARSTTAKKGLSLDVAAIGGMYAHTIYLIGTEKGLGVNLGGDVIATDSMILDSKGNLINKAHLSSKNITVSAQNINNTGSLLGHNIRLTATDLNNSGNKGHIQATGNVTIQLQGKLTNQSTLEAVGATSINSQNLTNTGTVLAKNGDMTINTQTLNNQGTLSGHGLNADAIVINNNSATSKILSTNDLSLTSQNTVTNAHGAQLKANGTLTIETQGDIVNTGSILESVNNITLKSRHLTNTSTSTLSAQNGTLSITNTGNLTNQGGIAGNQVTIVSASVSNEGNKALILGRDTFNIESKGDITNQDGAVLYSLGNGTIEVANTLTNS